MTEHATTAPSGPESRLSDPSTFVPELGAIAGGMTKAAENGSVPRTTILLAQLRIGQLIGSTYHTVVQSGHLREDGEPEERITAVASWRDAPHYFTGAELVALELVDAILTPNPSGERVPDELFARASAHYDEKALVTLCMAIGRSCFFAPITLVGKPSPGRAPGENWRK
ncbi:carboxymuconolactone decarboxylase family protein [Nonomuraea ceibae]|uniref:carboxymuconolactone decarboxylase family protein n=1 Tax=Nonomuraea ceibae TaxID=1935170 RepID=UPI001C5D4583|nr:carboxymuconolactone decarboxylase family protein [Nonomuraea ceibae]